MKKKFVPVCVTSLLITLCIAEFARSAELPAETALDHYVREPDSNYSWEIVSETANDGLKSVVVDMVSHTWRTTADVNRPEWRLDR